MLLQFHSRKFCDSILTCDGVSCKFIHPCPRKPSSYSSAVTAHYAIESPVGFINGGKPTRSCQHSKSEANSDLIALCRDGNLKEALGVLQIMDRQRIPADFSTYASLIQACADTKSLAEGRQVHTHLLNAGLGYNVSFGAKLVKMYAVCGRLEDACEVFDKICEPDARQVLEKMHNSCVVIWNAMIRAYVKNENYERAFKLYHQMQRLGVGPDKFTFPLVLKACAGLSYSQEGREIHDQIDSRGLDSDVFVVTALMDMYAKCGSIDSARQVFDKMSERDVVSWNAMIVGYCQNGHPDEALVLFHRMQATGIKPNSVTMGMLKMDTGMKH